MLAIQAGNSTSDSLGIDTAHSSRGGQRRTARRAGEPTQTTTIWRPANTIFWQLMIGCQPGRQQLLLLSMTCLVAIGLPRVRVFRERMMAIAPRGEGQWSVGSISRFRPHHSSHFSS
jgi:hypothetical protein